MWTADRIWLWRALWCLVSGCHCYRTGWWWTTIGGLSSNESAFQNSSQSTPDNEGSIEVVGKLLWFHCKVSPTDIFVILSGWCVATTDRRSGHCVSVVALQMCDKRFREASVPQGIVWSSVHCASSWRCLQREIFIHFALCHNKTIFNKVWLSLVTSCDWSHLWVKVLFLQFGTGRGKFKCCTHFSWKSLYLRWSPRRDGWYTSRTLRRNTANSAPSVNPTTNPSPPQTTSLHWKIWKRWVSKLCVSLYRSMHSHSLLCVQKWSFIGNCSRTDQSLVRKSN